MEQDPRISGETGIQELGEFVEMGIFLQQGSAKLASLRSTEGGLQA